MEMGRNVESTNGMGQFFFVGKKHMILEKHFETSIVNKWKGWNIFAWLNETMLTPSMTWTMLTPSMK